MSVNYQIPVSGWEPWVIIPADSKLHEIWPVRRTGCCRKHCSHLKFKKSHVGTTYLLAKMLHCCNVKDVGNLWRSKASVILWPTYFTLKPTAAQACEKNTVTSSWRPGPTSHPPGSRLRHSRSSHQVVGALVTNSHGFGFPWVGALPTLWSHSAWAVGLPPWTLSCHRHGRPSAYTCGGFDRKFIIIVCVLDGLLSYLGMLMSHLSSIRH